MSIINENKREYKGMKIDLIKIFGTVLIQFCYRFRVETDKVGYERGSIFDKIRENFQPLTGRNLNKRIIL